MLCADDLYWSNRAAYFELSGQYNGYGLVSSLDFTGKVLLRNHTQLGNPVRFWPDVLNTNNGQQICGRGPDAVSERGGLQPVAAADLRAAGGRPYARPDARDAVDAPRPPYSDQTIVDNVVGQAGKFPVGQDAVQLGNRRRADRVRHHRAVEVIEPRSAANLRHGSGKRLHHVLGGMSATTTAPQQAIDISAPTETETARWRFWFEADVELLTDPSARKHLGLWMTTGNALKGYRFAHLTVRGLSRWNSGFGDGAA